MSGSSTVQGLQDRFHVRVGLVGAFHEGFDIQGQAHCSVVWVFLVGESDLFIWLIIRLAGDVLNRLPPVEGFLRAFYLVLHLVCRSSVCSICLHYGFLRLPFCHASCNYANMRWWLVSRGLFGNRHVWQVEVFLLQYSLALVTQAFIPLLRQVL